MVTDNDLFFLRSADLMAIADGLGVTVRANPQWEKTLGWTAAEMEAKDLSAIVHAEDLDITRRSVAQLVDSGESRVFANRCRHRDGTYRWIEWRAFSHDGLLYATGHDITEQRAALAETDTERNLLLTLINTIPDSIFLKDRDSRFLLVNQAQAASVGERDPKDMIGKTDAAYMPPHLAAKFRADDLTVMEMRKTLVNMEEPGMDAAGAPRWLLTAKAPLLDSSGRVIGLVGSSRDITEQRQAELSIQELQQQLLQSQKMEAIGRLAGGVAHDFNNLLTTILGNGELITEEPDVGAVVLAHVKEIVRAAQRAADLTRQLLAFSRKQLLQPRRVDLNELVETLARMLRRLIGEDVTLDLDLSSDIDPVHADPGQIEQVILNLAVNARDAMPSGGTLTVRTRPVVRTAAEPGQRFDIPPGRYVELEVRDTGHGMDEMVKAHLFEPFFTTKESGKGTGLGLSTAYGIVKQSGGYITVDSRPGHGAAFAIYLPRFLHAESREEESGAVESVQGGRERILLVEDDASVLHLTARMLQSLGYPVMGVRSPGEAFAVLDKSNAPVIDLLITDVILTEMKGTELARSLQEARPHLRVLFMSGYTDEITFREGVLARGDAFLQKPFTRASLAAKVRSVLDAPVLPESERAVPSD